MNEIDRITQTKLFLLCIAKQYSPPFSLDIQEIRQVIKEYKIPHVFVDRVNGEDILISTIPGFGQNDNLFIAAKSDTLYATLDFGPCYVSLSGMYAHVLRNWNALGRQNMILHACGIVLTAYSLCKVPVCPKEVLAVLTALKVSRHVEVHKMDQCTMEIRSDILRLPIRKACVTTRAFGEIMDLVTKSMGLHKTCIAAITLLHEQDKPATTQLRADQLRKPCLRAIPDLWKAVRSDAIAGDTTEPLVKCVPRIARAVKKTQAQLEDQAIAWWNCTSEDAKERVLGALAYAHINRMLGNGLPACKFADMLTKRNVLN